jgi:ribosomal subunit interface protein
MKDVGIRLLLRTAQRVRRATRRPEPCAEARAWTAWDPTRGSARERRRHPPEGFAMQTLVSILHHDYPPVVRDTVDARLQHLERFHGRIVSLRALLERQRTDHRVELVANVGHGAVLVADARRDDFGAALDEAAARMERLLKRDHDRRIERRRS